MTSLITPPAPGTYASYQEAYIRLVNGKDPFRLLMELASEFIASLSALPPEKETFRYAEGKWTIKEVVGHIIDTERIMAYRALSIARGERQQLPGFDENEYAVNGAFNARDLQDLLHEFRTVRDATLSFYRSLDGALLDRIGIANGQSVTPRSLLYIILGHQLHHENILRERYF